VQGFDPMTLPPARQGERRPVLPAISAKDRPIMFSFVPRSRSQGFTLVELMITVAVTVTLLSVAAPGLVSFVARNQVAGIQSEFATSLSLARSEAARSGVPVLVAAAAGGAVGNEFANGWDLYQDQDSSGTVTDGDTLVRHFEALPSGVSVHGATTATFGTGGYLTPVATLTFKVCRIDGTTAGYSVTVVPSGVTYVAAITNC
jgi:type IV fimbrial biogenesis protein FimT